MINNVSVKRESLDYYLSLKYSIILSEDLDGGFTAEISELKGCATQGESIEEVMANIQDARELWITVAYENFDNIPLPVTDSSFSGKTLLRMPRSLHRVLSDQARREEVSLNQFIVSCLSAESSLKKLENLIMNINSNAFVQVQGYKKGKTIVVENHNGILESIPDGEEITIEIKSSKNTIDRNSQKSLESIAGIWKDEKEFLMQLDSMEEEEFLDEGINNFENIDKKNNS